MMSRSTWCALVAGVLTLIACPALAQQGSDTSPSNSFEITGLVYLSREKAAIAGVQVRLEPFAGSLNEQTTTDSLGRFRFSGLKPGQYTIFVRVSGFKEERQRVEITPLARRARILIELTPEESAPGRHSVTTTEVLDARVPPEATQEFEKGRAAWREKKVEKAILHLEKAVGLYPAFFDALLLLGAACLEMQQWEKAEDALFRTLESKPQTTAALVGLGEVHRRQQRYAEAEQALQKALKLDARCWQGYFTLGRVYWAMGDPAKAGPPVGRALQLNPNYAEAHLLGANIFMRVGLPENALIEYEEYLRLAPKGELAEQTRDLVRKLRQALTDRRPHK